MGDLRDSRVALQTIAGAFGGPGCQELALGDAWLASTGGPLAVFADGASATPGIQITNSKALTIRWNNHATPTAVGWSVLVPRDLDITGNVVVYANVSKTGATVGDATTFTVAAYNQVVGALHDADTNYGGATGALVGDATAKTIATLSRTLAAANLAAYPASMTLTMGPTAGLLGTDDLVLHAAWFTYTRKNPTV